MVFEQVELPFPGSVLPVAPGAGGKRRTVPAAPRAGEPSLPDPVACPNRHGVEAPVVARAAEAVSREPDLFAAASRC